MALGSLRHILDRIQLVNQLLHNILAPKVTRDWQVEPFANTMNPPQGVECGDRIKEDRVTALCMPFHWQYHFPLAVDMARLPEYVANDGDRVGRWRLRW